MEIDVNISGRVLSMNIEDPFRMDPAEVAGRIKEFAADNGLSLEGLDLEGLLPRMVKGVMGCEGGCPADAKALVARGYRDFQLEYVEGGILVANCQVNGSAGLSIRVFPEF